MTALTRRTLVAAGTVAAGGALFARPASRRAPAVHAAGDAPEVFFAVKYGMVQTKGSMADRFALLKDLGYDGVELDSPNGYGEGEVTGAREASGLYVHGLVNSSHWQVRLSDPDEKVRARAVAVLEAALRHSKEYGGSSMLLVPGHGNDGTQEEVWQRSIAGIRAALPLAARLGVHILIENVWNRFLYDHDGGEDQSAERLRDYLDAIGSPWVGSYFDIGNHQKYGRPADWIRTLGPRIVKLDVKDWGKEAGWSKIGEGDVDWADVRRALVEIGFTGWATAEVGGGDQERLAEIQRRMTSALRGS